MSVARLNLAQEGISGTTPRGQTRPNLSADSEDTSLALEASRQQLESVMRRNDELLRLRSVLAGKVSLLERALAKAHRFAYYDELTGLPNRRLLLDRYIQAAALANRHCKLMALAFFDLDGFKEVNDKLGHDAGDSLLQQVAARLSSAVRKSDTACRYGGDEFVVLLTDIDDCAHAVTTLQSIRARLASPYEIGGYSLRLTVSNGLAIYPNDAQCLADLMRRADRSMFGNKPAGRGRPDRAPKLNLRLRDAGREACLSRL
jgi:diguanylate cyclase